MIKKTFSKFLIFTCLFYLTTPKGCAQSANEIFNDFRKLRSKFKIDSSSENFVLNSFEKKTSAHLKLTDRIERIQEENAENIADLLAKSIKYIHDNHKKENIENDRDFRRVASIVRKLNHFTSLNTKLGDGGCLDNKDAKVRDMSNVLLLGTLAAELPDCGKEEKNHQEIDDLFSTVTKISHCVENSFLCDKNIDPNKGLYGVPFEQKKKFIKRFLSLKKRNNLIAKDVFNIAFGENCEGKGIKCSRIESAFTKKYLMNRNKKDELVKAINNGPLNNYKIKDSLNNIDGVEVIEPINGLIRGNGDLHQTVIKVSLPKNETLKKNTISEAFQSSSQFSSYDKKEPVKLKARGFVREQIFKNTPLGFASRGALEKCVPRLFGMLYENPKAFKSNNGLITIELPLSTTIKTKDLDCIKKNSLSEYNTVLDDSYNRYTKKLNSIKEPLPHKDDFKYHRSERGYNIRRKNSIDSANEKLDELLQELITEDPVTFGALLVETDQDYGIKTICKSIIQTVEANANKDSSGAKMFGELAMGGVVLSTAGMFIIGGPVGVALMASSIGLASYETYAYGKKAKKYEQKAKVMNYNDIRITQRLQGNESAKSFSDKVTAKYRKNMDLATEAKFYQYLNFATANLGSGGLILGAKLNHVNILNPSVTLSPLSYKVMAWSAEKSIKRNKHKYSDKNIQELTRKIQILKEKESHTKKHLAHKGKDHPTQEEVFEVIEIVEKYAKGGEAALTSFLTWKYSISAVKASDFARGVNSLMDDEKGAENLYEFYLKNSYEKFSLDEGHIRSAKDTVNDLF